MSMTPSDAAWEEFYDKMSEELYQEHKDQAINEFTEEQLQSFYLENQNLMRPAVDAIQEGKKLQEDQYFSAALVFFVSAIEILLKTTLLKPVIYGLIHNEVLAEVIAENFLKQSGLDRYKKLMSKIFQEVANVDLSHVKRESSDKLLIVECDEIQKIRNRIIHQGFKCLPDDAELSNLVAASVFGSIVKPFLYSIGLTVVERGEIIPVK